MKYPITIIGMGPGNPQLLTLAAKKALDEADVILFDCCDRSSESLKNNGLLPLPLFQTTCSTVSFGF